MAQQETKAMQQKVGAVTVIGGGIAGIQSALDIANSGYKVYLVEEQSNVGGVMAQLDKTFPTNDCSSCMMGPKLVELAGHRNIEVLTRTTVESVEGEPGNFTVTLRRHPRYVREDRCTGCGECAKVCPIDVPADFNLGLNDRQAIYRHYPQAIPPTFAIDKLDKSPCTNACPNSVNAHGYVALVAQGRYNDAMEVILRNLPLPGVIGRICPHPCETACRRAEVDSAVSICALKRFVADRVDIEEVPLPKIEKRQEKVAIIGSGPAGITAAHFLALDGFDVTVHEAMPKPGGMLRFGIPDYRLPKEVLDKEIRATTRLGVEIRCNSTLGRDFTVDSLFAEGYRAVFLAIGAHRSIGLNIPGEDGQGVVHGSEFVRRVNTEGAPDFKGKKVVVLGGGEMAIDAARCAIRSGADVSILYRRSEREMPARNTGLSEAISEGVKVEYLVSPRQILRKDGRMTGLECVRMSLGDMDSTGRRRPVPVPGSVFMMEADMIMPALGQVPDALFLQDSGVKLTSWGTVESDPVTFSTSREGVFAGGDGQSGPWVAIGAVCQGREAAVSITRFIDGRDMAEGREPIQLPQTNFKPVSEDISKVDRAAVRTISRSSRQSSFDEVELGLSETQARAEASKCLNCMVCCECRQCEKACMANAIDHEMVERVERIEAGAVVYSPGFKPFDARLKPEYGYGIWPNVITSLEYERVLSAAGPFEGHIQRLSDGKKPERIAWIQCVGSRDSSMGKDYCSYVCCMYATKQAMITKEHEHDIDTTIFYIDMRAQGKGFDRFYERARDETGVRYVRSMVSRVVPVPGSDKLRLNFSDDNGGEIREEDFDLVVLSVGLCSHPSTAATARRLGIELDRYGFSQADPMDLVASSRPGVFVCGAAQGPKDIPDSVQQGSSAAACATALLSEARGTMITPAPQYDERDISAEIPRVGVFVCHCGINIASTVDVAAVSAYASTLPGVEYASHCMFACSTDQQKEIKRVIEEYGLNRVVVASCTPRTHEPLFRNTLREAGLNQYLFDLANIREHDSWVHQAEPDLATEKAKDLVRMSVSRVSLLEPVYDFSYPVVQKALVVGGGLAGLTAALSIAEQGFPSVLVESSPELGGNARTLHYTEDGANPSAHVADLIGKAQANPLITIFTSASVQAISGSCGNFSTTVSVDGQEREISHGVALVAIGAEEYKPSEYLYGKDPRVVTQKEFESMLVNDPEKVRGLRQVTMIQCVGSREPENSYCSRVCCTSAMKNGIKLKEINPAADVSVIYRDIRTFGLKELAYRDARRKGVRFFRFEPDRKPEIKANGSRLEVSFEDAQLKRPINLGTDLLVLGAAIRPRPDTKKLAEVMRLPLDQDGFFLEAHLKLRPLDFATNGLFLCGLAQGPKFASESVAQAKGAVSRAVTILSQKEIVAEGVVTAVDPKLCRACGECEQTCLFGAIKVEMVEGRRQANVTRALCTGCGACNAACPTGAASLAHFRDGQINAVIRSVHS